jgi:hypothetical protein
MMRSVGISLVVAVALMLCGVASANAADKIPSGVTIHYREATHRLYGYVFSKKPQVCAAGRYVAIFRKQGREFSDAERIDSERSSLRVKQGKAKWRFRESYHPLTTGDYFARITTSPSRCDTDYSKVIHISVPRPNTKITGMTIHHRSHRVRFQYAATGGSTPYHFRCRLDPDYARRQRCDRDGKTFVHVSPGRHVFIVKAIGSNGLDDASSAKLAFRM